jgi:hypothetical protein
VQKRVQIYAFGVGMIALGWAALPQNPIAASIAFGGALVAVVLAFVQRDDPDSASGLRKRLLRLAKLARATSPQEFYLEHYHDMDGARQLAGSKFFVFPPEKMSGWLSDTRTKEHLERCAQALEALADHLKRL